MNEIKQTLQQDADALLKRLQQSRKNGTGVTLGVSDVGVLCEVLGGEYVVVSKSELDTCYLDENEGMYLTHSDFLAEINIGEVVEVERQHFWKTTSLFAAINWDEANNDVGYYELFETQEEAEKAATHCKAMIEAAQENSHE